MMEKERDGGKRGGVGKRSMMLRKDQGTPEKIKGCCEKIKDGG
jgi:hypothetical protein